jgi:hypothetical protein
VVVVTADGEEVLEVGWPAVFPVGSDRSALSVFRQVGFSGPSSEPDVRLPSHPALHRFVPLVRRR